MKGKALLGSWLVSISSLMEAIKFSHSVFALPFALLSAFWASEGSFEASMWVWIIVAMVSARSAAMAFNRLVDMPFDAQNPRTSSWPHVQGRVSQGQLKALVLIASGVFMVSAYMLNSLAFVLSPIALGIIFFYSYTKRFTALSHFFLGLALAVAPLGAWVAIRAEVFHPIPMLLALSVLLWVSGFDIIYACQDLSFDRRWGLFSLPVKLGIKGALRMSLLLHLLMVSCLFLIFLLVKGGAFYFLGLSITALLLLYEHSLVKAHDLSMVHQAFFTTNGMLSVFFCVLCIVDGLL